MNSPDPITRLNAALEGRYRIERELPQPNMFRVDLMILQLPESRHTV